MSLSEHFDDELATGGPLEDDDFLVDRGILLFGTTLLPQTLVLDPRTWILRPPTSTVEGDAGWLPILPASRYDSCFSVFCRSRSFGLATSGVGAPELTDPRITLLSLPSLNSFVSV